LLINLEGVMEKFKKVLLEEIKKMKPITKESYGSEFEAGEENGYYSAICDVIKLLEGK